MARDKVKSTGGVAVVTPAMIEAQLMEAKAKKIELLEKVRIYRETHKLEEFVPHAKQQEFFAALQDKSFKTYVILGSNRSGKTEAAVASALSLALGRYPWVKQPVAINREGHSSMRILADKSLRVSYHSPDKSTEVFDFPDEKSWKQWKRDQLNPFDAGGLRFKVPIKIRMLAEDMTALEQVQLPKFRKLCAPEWVAAKKKNSFGLDVHWIFHNGSVIDFLTYQQDTSMMEGWDGHVVLYDEPPPRDKYVANLRGLVDHGGISIFSMTPLKEPWIADELVNKNDPSIYTSTMTIRDNPHISAKDIETFAAALTDDEKETRLEGKFLHLQGLVFKDFNKLTHVKPCREPPKDSTVYCAIDPHARTPHALVFMWVDRRGNMFVCHDIFRNGTPDQIAEWVIQFHDSIHHVEQVIIDPYSKGDQNRGETTYEIVERLLADKGIPLDLGSKDLSSGILQVQECLKSRNGLASLFIDPSCERTIFEVQRIVWADWKGQGTDKEQMNKPVAKDNHMWENIRRLIQYPAEYRSPRSVSDLIQRNQWKPSDDMAGY
jgi:hypothetical protein